MGWSLRAAVLHAWVLASLVSGLAIGSRNKQKAYATVIVLGVDSAVDPQHMRPLAPVAHVHCSR